MKRLISWLLALTMIMSLPLSAFAAGTDVEVGEGGSDVEVGFEELLPGYSADNRLTVAWTWNKTQTEAMAQVTVPAGKTMYFEYQGDPSFALFVNGEEYEFTAAQGRTDTNKFQITNSTDAEVTYELGLKQPVGSYNNPEKITELDYYTVNQAAGDNDGYCYTYTATETGTITFYFTEVPGTEDEYDENGEIIVAAKKYTCDISVTNMRNSSQKTLLVDGVDNFGLELTVNVNAGDELLINVAAVKDLEGNFYPEAIMTWYGAFAYPAGSELNPITIEWTWDDAYANATATVTVEADGTYFNGNAGMILTVDGVETAQENGVFVLNAGTYELALATPVGAYNNPEVIENIDGYTDSNSLGENEAYYYIWTATEDGTVTLNITNGANITVTNQNTYAQSTLAEVDYDENYNPSWSVAQNLTVEVKAGETLKIEVAGLTNFETYTTPAIDYTLTGSFEKAGPVIDENLKFQTIGLSFQDYIGVDFVVTKAAFGAYDNVYIESVQADAVQGNIEETLQGTNLGTAMKRFQKEVLSWSMPEQITVTLYGVKGDVVTQGQTVTTSVEQLALAKIGDYAAANNTKACTALVNMLNYGAAVQAGYNHNASVLPNANLGDYAQYATVEDPAFNATNSSEGTGSITVRTNSVSMQSKVEIQFAFMNVDVSAYELRYTVNGTQGKIAGSDFAVQGPFKTAKIAVKAADMRSVYTVALYDPATDEPVTAIYTVSVEAYAKGQVGGTYDAVVKALLKYGDSVAALAG